MDGKQKFTVSVFALFLLVSVVSGATFSFIDDSYLGNNRITITDQNGGQVANFSGNASGISLPPGVSYSIGYVPSGFFDLADETPSTWPSLYSTVNLVDKNLAGIAALIGIIIVAILFRSKS
jgi:hypothetical protein